MTDYSELIERSELHDPPVAKAIRALQADNARQLEIYHNQRKTIGELVDKTEALQEQVKELDPVIDQLGKPVGTYSQLKERMEIVLYKLKQIKAMAKE